MKIVPSLLAEKFETFLLRLRQAESFTDYVQIDLMDGVFVPAKSFAPERINDISTSLTFELHLMVKDPSNVMEGIDHPGIKKVIFHFESTVDHRHLINALGKRGIPSGLAIRPETAIGDFRVTAEYVDTLLFLTVSPGFYGNPFQPDVLAKIVDARKLFPTKTITVDGGVSLDNLSMFIEIGADSVCVGSRIFLEGNPKENYRRFTERTYELEMALRRAQAK